MYSLIKKSIDDVIDENTDISELSEKSLCKTIEARLKDRLITDCNLSLDEATSFMKNIGVLRIVKVKNMIPGYDWENIKGKWPTEKTSSGGNWFGNNTGGMKGWDVN